ncbi:EAL domain-containing protein [Vibrio parahaemolyticus]|uniref:EAL domain-containing protein n=1 Tax=Vibrio parahaemolyticus TaxID=670 RepID=UPI00235F55A0|nr:EAL domain-containing protein [Vibrio parahaemolyticus]
MRSMTNSCSYINSNVYKISPKSGIRLQPVNDCNRDVVCHEVLSYFSDHLGRTLPPELVLSMFNQKEINQHTLTLAALAIEHCHTPISLNLLGSQLKDECLVKNLCMILRAGDVVELVEKEPVALDHFFLKAAEMFQYHEIKIALDDFGSGHFNFDILALEPVHYLKLDMNFFHKIYASEGALQMLQGLLKSLKCYEVKVAVEGIESQAEFELCRQAGVDWYQGYYLGKPYCIS